MEILADFESMSELFGHIFLFECLIGALFFIMLFPTANSRVVDKIIAGERFSLLSRVKGRIYFQVVLAAACLILSAVSIILILDYGMDGFTRNPYLKLAISALFILCSVVFLKNWANVDKSARKEITALWNIQFIESFDFDRARNTLPANFKYRKLTEDELFDPKCKDVRSYFYCDEPDKTNDASSVSSTSDVVIEDYETELEQTIKNLAEEGSKLDALRYCVEEKEMTVEEGLDAVEDCAGPSDEYESNDEDDIEYFLLLKTKDDGVIEAAKYYNEMTDADFFESAEKVKEVTDLWGMDLPTEFF